MPTPRLERHGRTISSKPTRPARSRGRAAPIAAVALGVLAACGPTIVLEDDTGGSAGTTSTTTAPATSVVPVDPTLPPGTTEPPSDTTGVDEVGFLPDPDTHHTFECDIFEQDCPPGHKCMPWANDGSNSWSSTRCSPVVRDPDGVGEPCTVEGSPTSGIDTCDHGMICWNVDPEQLEGTCFAFCVGDESNPHCEDPSAECAICQTCTVPVCIPQCDPLAQDCAEGQACYPVVDDWQCAPNASGDMGAPGEPCEFLNVCDPGNFCADASLVPGCRGAAGCCSPLCALDDPMPPCLVDQGCVPWYEPGAAPPGYENVGACALPK